MTKHRGVPVSRLVVICFIIVIAVSSAFAKRDDDVVFLKNGDRMTGEIKGLQRGELKFKSSYMAQAVILDWSKVERLETKDRFMVFLTDGQLFTDFVRLNSASVETDNFMIGKDRSWIKVKQIDVLKLTPVEASFWSQLEGSVDFGFDFTSGNDQYSTNLAATVSYRKGDNTVTASVDSAFSGQRQGTSSARKEFTLDYRRRLSPNYYAGGLFDLLSSDQQDLDLRTTVGGLLGRNLLQNERTRLSVFGGIAGTREKYDASVGKPHATNADGIAGVDFTTFRFRTTSITSRFTLFPSITDPGRMRMQTTSNLKIEVLKDLYWGFSIYENFDSRPPTRADKNDLGVTTSLGWKF